MTSFHTSAWAVGLSRVLRAIALAGAFAGGLCVLAILASYSTEVFMRYALDAPTAWASDSVKYFLCGAIFLTMPQLTIEGSHVAVTVFAEKIPATLERYAVPVGLCMSAGTCFFVGWLAFQQVQYNFVRGIDTMSLVAVPKWVVTAPIAYGFIVSGLVLSLKLFEPAASRETAS